MTRAAALSARLPGLRFEVIQPQRADVLPRMDITAFVGFSASGPLHVPVLVEDAAQFEAVFGDDLFLAWDAERGEQVYAYLAPAVRAFFRNGGRRCWVIRVAGETAQRAWFPVPGLARFDGTALLPAFIQGRSAGAWSEVLRVGTALLSQPTEATAFDAAHQTLDLHLRVPGQVVVGDLLRLTYLEKGYTIYFPVSKLDSLESGADSPEPGSARQVRVSAEKIFCLRPAARQLPPGVSGILTAYNHLGVAASVEVRVPEKPESIIGSLDWPADDESLVSLNVTGAWSNTLKTTCVPGALVRVDFPGGRFTSAGHSFWMLVDDFTADDKPADPPRVRLLGQGVWQVSIPPDLGAWGLPDFLERLTFEIWTRQPEQTPRHLSELGFTASQPRFWAALPSDEQLYSAQAGAATGDSSFADQPNGEAAGVVRTDLWQSAQTPRFPLAGPGESGDIFLPLVMAAIPTLYARPDETSGDALVREGLDNFGAGLFLDPALANVGDQALLEQADYLRYTSMLPRHLRGVHAALSVDEVTLIAVPDATHRGWFKSPSSPQPAPQPVLPLTRPEWGEFLPCDIRLVPAPSLSATPPDLAGSFTLAWTSPVAVDRFILEESAFADFSDAREIYRGPAIRLDLLGYGQGDTYYHIRSEIDRPDGSRDSSDWSYGIGVRIAPPTGWQVTSVENYNSDTLCAVQRNLLRLCGARGDLFAIFSIPGHFREQESIDYALELRSPLSRPISIDVPALGLLAETKKVLVSAIGYGEAHDLSFGALYHPWLYSTDNATGTARLNPPDGCIAGLLAQRAYERGAWVAPANQAIRNVVALEPLLSPARWLDIQEAHINLLRQEPDGFLALSENTLSDDPDWTLVNVRRLISLMRRLAQRYGPTWVFEPNDDAFARLVKRTFVSLLDQMFARGAFAGPSPATAYQVNVVVTPQDIDEGRFIVELCVAPSEPLRFITVRLIQSGEHSLVTEGT